MKSNAATRMILLGETVKSSEALSIGLVDKVVAAGKHTVSWDGTNNAGQQMASGVYFYTLETESFYQTKKMMLIK